MKRRHFCTGAISSLVFSELLALKLTGFANEAFGAVGDTPLKNYVSFWTGGAERCWFDGILTPNGTLDSLGSGPGVFTYLNVPGGNKFEYRTTSQKVNGKYYLPHLWDCNLPTLSGDTIPMSSLAANTAIIRGAQTGLTFDAHAQNAEKMQVPFPGVSIIGSIADSSSNILIPAIISGGHFTSQTNKSASNIGVQSNAHDIFKSLEMGTASARPYTKSASAMMGRKKFDTIVSSFIQSISSQVPARSKQTM